MKMLGFSPCDQGKLLKILINDLRPDTAAAFLPGLPAYVLFLCIRYLDHLDDEDDVRSFLNAMIKKIFFHVKRHRDDLQMLVLWLVNVCRLLHIMKQFSGEKEFQIKNTNEQNEESLCHFDLKEYREILSDLSLRIFHHITENMEFRLLPLIDPALVEETPALIPCIKDSNRRRSSMFMREVKGAMEKPPHLTVLLDILTTYDNIVICHCIDPQIREQIFQQVLCFISSTALDSVLQQPNICNWEGALRIRFNAHQVEKWAQERKLNEVAVKSLQPLVQATQLILTRKTMDDVQNVCSLSDCLTSTQVLRLLKLYSPIESTETKPSDEFIENVREQLEKERDIGEKRNESLYSERQTEFPLLIPYNPSSIRLCEINVPEEFGVNSILHQL